MKKWLIGIFIVLIIVVIIVVVALQATKGVVKSADKFFALIQTGKVEEAYNSTAREFQAAASLEVFQKFLEIATLDNFARASWTTRSISGNTGKLIGSIHTKEGGVVPIEIDFVKEEGQWKILRITKQTAGISQKQKEAELEEAAPLMGKEVPSDETLAAMISESIWILGDGINKNDLANFYNHIAKIWQRQTDASSLKQAFYDFIDKKIDLTIIQGQTPVLSEPPAIDNDGVLRLKGYYATQPYIINFELGYLYEHPQWRLVAVNIHTK